MAVVGLLLLGGGGRAVRLACSDDARLLLVGRSDGTLLCLDVLFRGGGGGRDGGELAVRFAHRWEMTTIGAADDDYDDGGGVRFPSLEFLRGGDGRHHFLAVAESAAGGGAAGAYLMDAASSSSDPPSRNLWPAECAELGDIGGGAVSCAAARPPSSDAPLTTTTTIVVAFGTTAGSLGVFSTSMSGDEGGVLRRVDCFPLPNAADDDNDDGEVPWKVAHLNWFDAGSIAVGLTRVIVDPDCEDDDDDDVDDDYGDGPNDHQASFLVGTTNGCGGGPADPSAWTFAALGDVVPFFSVPRGGRHAFHTAALPSRSSEMLLVGCNVANDVAVLYRRDGGDWDVLELIEGCQMSCPADEDDEFSYLMGLAVVMLPLGRDPALGHPFPLLASSDGSLTGFVPRHRSAGATFFARRMSIVGLTPDMGVPLPISSRELPIATALDTMPTEGADDSGKCIFSGLDLGLNSVYMERLNASDDDDDDDDENSDDDTASLDSAGSSEESKVKGPNRASSSVSAFMSNFSAPSFSYGETLTDTTPPKSASASFGFVKAGSPSGTIFGSAFGVTSTSFGAAPAITFGSSSGASSASSQNLSLASVPVFGSQCTPGPMFGSIATSKVGFGALAASSGQTEGFGFGTEVNGEEDDETKDPTSSTQKAPSPAPVFGSGFAPVFGSDSTPKLGFASLVAKAVAPDLGTKPSTNAFGSFGGISSSIIVPSTPTPLFGGTTQSGDTHGEETQNTEASGHCVPKEDEELIELIHTPSGKKAVEVFNKILSDSGSTDSHLPISKFESLVEEVGEGFHGDELDKQLTLVDHASTTGEITKSAFVMWYCNLVDQEGDDSSQESEIAEEKAKAEKAFDALGKGSTKIPVSDFSKLFESMGTTYCEEEHTRTIKKISTLDESGEMVLTRKAFLDWYVDWLFGDGDSDESEIVDESVEEHDSNKMFAAKVSDGKAEGWGSTFKASEEGSWKCGTCMVTNKPSATKCAACETPKPGEEGKPSEAVLTKPAVSGGSIGTGGFTFGSALPSATSSTGGGSAFGASSIGSGGFSFGGLVSKPA